MSRTAWEIVNRSPHCARYVAILFGWIAAICGANSAVADSPHVTGFDRFGRHAEIDALTSGKLLLAELSCTACHKTTEVDVAPKNGPNLQAAGTRINPAWIRQFISNPSQTKPGTTMPDVLGGFPGPERSAAVDALVAYVTSLKQPFPIIKGSGVNPVPFEFWNHGDAQRGELLYHKTGCVACHEPGDDVETAYYEPSAADRLIDELGRDELDDLGLAAAARAVPSVPQSDLAIKYTKQALTHFLIDPHRVRPAGRMPDFQLRVVDAADIAAYLLDQSDVASPVAHNADPDLVETGRQLFSSVGCSNCHKIGSQTHRDSKPLAELRLTSDRSCLSNKSGFPNYNLDSQQRAAIVESIGSNSTDSELKSNGLNLSLLKLNCYACHQRDSLGGVGRDRKAHFDTVGGVDLGDEGRLPPPLSGVGRKLQPGWMTQVLSGKGTIRPHMTIKMPVYPKDEMKALMKRFVKVDSTAHRSAEIAADATDGHKLMDVGCVQCHEFSGAALPGVVGVDLAGVTKRVRRQWFESFLRNPGAVKPRTRMPNFFADGTTQDQTIGGGDMATQIAGMWEYLDRLDQMPLPQKIETARAADYELKPSDRAKILRTFMTEAGTHAIAVGLPGEINYAFDAENARVAQAWKGRFVDAQGTWFVRFAPPAEPLGEDTITLPSGPTVARLGDRRKPWPQSAGDELRFLGYQLAADGIPTFRYEVDGATIRDRLEVNRGKLKRTLEISNPGIHELQARLLVGQQLSQIKSENSSSCTNDNGTTIHVSSTMLFIRNGAAGKQEAVLPIRSNSATTVMVTYQW